MWSSLRLGQPALDNSLQPSAPMGLLSTLVYHKKGLWMKVVPSREEKATNAKEFKHWAPLSNKLTALGFNSIPIFVLINIQSHSFLMCQFPLDK